MRPAARLVHPPAEIARLRDLTRYRTKLVQERARETQRIQKLLEDAGIKLDSVATDILGKSCRRMLGALFAGERDPDVLAEMAMTRMRPKIGELRQAHVGRFNEHLAQPRSRAPPAVRLYVSCDDGGVRMFHQFGGRWIHSVSFGSGRGTFVGVAGSFANWEIWAPTFEQLSARWRVIGFDHDGVGETKAPVEQITRERQLETLFSVLDAQRVDRCVIAGDSNNAALALEAILHEPDRFDGLVIVNGHAWGFDTPDARRFAKGLREHFDETVRVFVELVFPEADSDHLKVWLADIITRTGAEAAARIVEMYFGVDLRPRLRDLDVPAMVIHGVRDALSSSALSDAKELAAALRAELRLLDDAGHLPLLSRPDDVSNLLDAFLDQHSSSS